MTTPAHQAAARIREALEATPLTHPGVAICDKSDLRALLAERDELRKIAAEMLEFSDNWPGIAYTTDLELRARAIITNKD